jgi:hypothetical protein
MGLGLIQSSEKWPNFKIYYFENAKVLNQRRMEIYLYLTTKLLSITTDNNFVVIGLYKELINQ